MWHEYAAHAWVWMGFALLASLLVLAAAVLWFAELLSGWPWRDRDHPLRDELDRIARRQRRGGDHGDRGDHGDPT